MSKVAKVQPEMAQEYDFSRGKRGLFYDNAKNGIRIFHVSDQEDRSRPATDPLAKKARSPKDR